jgi:hypothetical protein
MTQKRKPDTAKRQARPSKSGSKQQNYANLLLVFFQDLLLQRHFWKILPIAPFIEFMGMVII